MFFDRLIMDDKGWALQVDEQYCGTDYFVGVTLGRDQKDFCKATN